MVFLHFAIPTSVSSTGPHGLIAHFFLLLSNIRLCSCAAAHVPTSEILAIVDKAALNVQAQVFVWASLHQGV